MLLSSLYQSSSANTEDELRNSVKLGPKSELLKVQSEDVNHITKGSNVKIANKMYITHEGVLSDSFKNVVSNTKSSIEQVDFSQGSILANQMNAWVEEQTNGLIKNLVSSDSIKSNIELFLVNTIYFKARWLQAFSKNEVFPGNFKSYSGQTQQTDMMTIFTSFNYTKLDSINSEIVELPYIAGSNYVYWGILPKEGETIKNVADHLNSKTLNDIKTAFRETRMFVNIPKYEVELETDAVSVMKNLGVQTIFSNDAKLNLLEGKPSLKVDQIKQKAKIIVDTDGTEAAAGSCMFCCACLII